MIESNPIPHEPQELNHQLIVLYDLLPRRDQRFIKTESTPAMQLFGLPDMKWQKPKNSELKIRIMARLNDLLPQAYITPSFQKILLEVFEGLCDYGTWKEIEPDCNEMRGSLGDKLADQMQKDFVYDTVITNSIDGGGIFDPNDAVRIERIAYQREFLGRLSTNEAMARLYRNLNRQGGNNGEYKPNPKNPRAQTLHRWRQEFIERYNDEP